MFTLSARGVYGLIAVIELAQQYSNGPTQIKDIAATHGIPQHYLEQLLVILKKTGLVESYRGSQGGYTLASPPSRIKVYDVLTCLEGKLEIVPEPKKSGSLSFFWNEIERTIKGCLNVSLEELINQKQLAEKHFVYNI